MSQISDFAELSSLVYSRAANDQPPDLKSLGGTQIEINPTESEAATGFYAEAWNLDGKVVIAFRGTDFNAPNLGDWTQGNISLGLGGPLGLREGGQWDAAQSFVQRVLNSGISISQIVFTGHSLGGGLAGLAAAKFGAPAYAYAPAPFKNTSDTPFFVPTNLSDGSKQILATAQSAYFSEFDLAIGNGETISSAQALGITAAAAVPGYLDAVTERDEIVKSKQL